MNTAQAAFLAGIAGNILASFVLLALYIAWTRFAVRRDVVGFLRGFYLGASEEKKDAIGHFAFQHMSPKARAEIIAYDSDVIATALQGMPLPILAHVVGQHPESDDLFEIALCTLSDDALAEALAKRKERLQAGSRLETDPVAVHGHWGP